MSSTPYDSVTTTYQGAEKRFTDEQNLMGDFLREFLGLVRQHFGGGTNVWLTPLNEINVRRERTPDQILSFDGKRWSFNLSIAVKSTANGEGLICVPLFAEVKGKWVVVNMTKSDVTYTMPAQFNDFIMLMSNTITEKLRKLTLPPNSGQAIIIE